MSAQPTRLDAPRPDGGGPRVLFVLDALAYNGAVCMAADLAPRLQRAGAPPELYVLLPVEGRRRVPVDPAIRVVQGSSGRVRMRWTLPRALWRLLRAARRADVVVPVSEVGPGLLLGYLAARASRRPFVTMVHADLGAAVEQWVPGRLRRATRFVHRRADAAICVSEGLVDPVVANGLAPERIHVVPTGIDVARVRELGAAPSELEAGELPRVVGLGRLSEEKGFDLLVRVHALVRGVGVEHELVLIGEGPSREPLRRLADELGVGGSLRLPGLVDNPFPIIAGASLFVLPSRREGLPLALLEALALGVPVIASKCGRGIEEALGDGELGELVEVESVAALADALGRHLAEPERLRARARAAAAQAVRYDVDRTAASLVEVLCGLATARVEPGRLTTASETTND